MKTSIVLLIIACLFGCTLQKDKLNKDDQVIFEQLMENIRITMPSDVYQELKEKKVCHKSVYPDNLKEIIYSIGNDQDDPTLRLDFTYDDGKLIQYNSKEYGFVDHSMSDNWIDEKQAIVLVKQFAKVFLKEDVKPIKRTPMSGYDTPYHITFEDEQQRRYLVQTNRNMVINYHAVKRY